MLDVLERLAGWPAVSGAKPLQGALAGRYRVRPVITGFSFTLLAMQWLSRRLGTAMDSMNEVAMAMRRVIMKGREYVLVPRKQWESVMGKSAPADGKALKVPPPSQDGSYSLEHVRISLANKMVARRKAAGLTQAQLARQAGVRVETISRLENGLHMPGVRTFDRIERALNRAAKRPAA